MSSKSNDLSAFDLLLKDYLSGYLANSLAECGITKIKIFVDWHSDYKCIDIQGMYNNYYIEYVGEVEHLGRCELNTFDAEN